jgi:hypothetical protein
MDLAKEANRWIDYSSHAKRDFFGADGYCTWTTIRGTESKVKL